MMLNVLFLAIQLVLSTLAFEATAGGGLDAPELFERIKALEGDWTGHSTEGWTGAAEIRTIARGSAVVVTSTFEAHPGETMITVYHLDGKRLMLTHYCVAKNQPRLVATSWEPRTGTARFSFLDATNLSSRDQGHMDSAIIRLSDPDRISARWTWYQEGSEKWMEEITWERKK